MTEKVSAKIYQFPAGGRSDPARRRATILPAAGRGPRQETAVSFGSGWYHEEAIREDELARAKVPGFPSRH